MDRTEYLNRMNRALYCVAHDIPIPPECIVEYQGIRYYPCEYIMTSDGNGNYVHKALLHDLKANSTSRADLDQVKEYTTPCN